MYTWDSEGKPEPLKEFFERNRPGSNHGYSIPDTEPPHSTSETRSGGSQASVHNDSAPQETNPPAGPSHEADASEHVQGRSVPEGPPANSHNRQSSLPGRLSPNDGFGSNRSRSNVQSSHLGLVGSWNRTFETFADQEERLGLSRPRSEPTNLGGEQIFNRNDTASTQDVAGPLHQNPPEAPRLRNLSTPSSLSDADQGMFPAIPGADSQHSTSGAGGEQTTGGTDDSAPPETSPLARDSHEAGPSEAAVHNSLAPPETSPLAGDSHEAGPSETAVHDGSAPSETNSSAGDSHEAGSGEYVEGKSTPECPPPASEHQIKP